MLDQVKIVLVGTSHSGNIGSAARAMKVMGLSQLVLVDPQCEVDEQALALAVRPVISLKMRRLLARWMKPFRIVDWS